MGLVLTTQEGASWILKKYQEREELIYRESMSRPLDLASTAAPRRVRQSRSEGR